MRLVISAVCVIVLFSYAAAYDPLDPNGNITIKWDVVSWTPDGYVAVVTMSNFQMFRHIMNPGWTLGWTWAKKEVIWSMVGAQTTEQGDCSKFKGNVPHCCKKTPTVVDLLPGVPYNQQFSNCCKGGVVAAWGQDPSSAVSSFQVSIGLAGTSNKTVKLPKNFTLLGPGPGYTCGPAKVVPSTVFLTPDKRRKTQALMTWNVTCTYSQFLARKNPSCCVSLSSFYNETITPCPSCACGCQNRRNCVKSDSKRINMVGIHTPKKDNEPLLQCTHHMCPIRVHWHVKLNYKDYWRVKVAVTNFNYRMNYSLWTLAIQHPNLNNVTQVFSFDYKPLLPYESINDTGMFYGMKYFNDLLMEAGPTGNVQSEILLQKNQDTFTFKQGWAFPRKVYFNGEELAEVEAKLDKDWKASNGATKNSKKDDDATKKHRRSFLSQFFSPIFLQAFSITFFEEWGDKSQLATIGLAADENPFGVVLGGILGQALCTTAAVVGGKSLASQISEKIVALSGGILFIVFGIQSFLSPVES